MDKDKYTPSQKKVIFIFALMLFLPLIVSYFAVKYNWGENFDNIVFVFALIISGFFVYFNNKAKKEESALNFLDELKEMIEGYFKDVDAEKKNYRGSWSAVEEWKQKMQEKAYHLAKRFKKEGESDAVLEDWEELDFDLDNGLSVIQDGNNPLVVQEGKSQSESSTFDKIGTSCLIILPSIFLYLVLSSVSWGIFWLTFVLGWFLFPNWLPPTQYDLEKFNFKHLLGIIFISGIGYFLNNWTYAQSGEVQIAVTIALPLLYGLIYYKIKHKKSVREL